MQRLGRHERCRLNSLSPLSRGYCVCWREGKSIPSLRNASGDFCRSSREIWGALEADMQFEKIKIR